MKWKKHMESLGLNESNISQGIKTKIKDYNEIVDGISQLKETIADPDLNDDVNELNETLTDLNESLDIADRDLVEALDKFAKLKDTYAERGRKMAEGRAKKKEGQSSPESKPTPKPAEPPVNTKPVPAKTEEREEVKEAGSGNWGLFLGTLALAIITFGIYKGRD